MLRLAAHQRIKSYHPSGLSFIIGFALMPLLFCAALPFAIEMDARGLLILMIGVPMLSIVGIGIVAHGYLFTFDGEAAMVTVETRAALVLRLNEISYPFGNVTVLDWEEGTEGGGLVMECQGHVRFHVTNSDRKAKRILQLVAAHNPNLRRDQNSRSRRGPT